MADIASDAIVIADADGSYYVVPRDVIEQTRVDDAAREQIDNELGVDTEGFGSSLGLGFKYVGALTLKQQNAFTGKLPQIGWPYYMPAKIIDQGRPAE